MVPTTSLCPHTSMIEAIGASYMEAYFGKVASLLKPDGLALIRAITIASDHRVVEVGGFHQASRVSRQLHPLRQRHADGEDPRQRSGARAPGGFWLLVRPHARSLAHTISGAASRSPERDSDDRFARLWEFYLAYCAMRAVSVSAPSGCPICCSPGLMPGRSPRAGLTDENQARHELLDQFIGYQLAWFITVIGAGNGLAWPSILASMAFVLWQVRASSTPGIELRLLVVALALGMLVDGAFAISGWVRYATPAPAWPPGGAPLWILALWASFAMTLNGSLRYLQGRMGMAVVLGAVGGPLAYLGAARGWAAK